ncbi:MAG TPA: Hsp70 family protein, partial [Xanthomonadales bacterium]|nr:Hsp70 family protein [Xanthomonadales bacterium]
AEMNAKEDEEKRGKIEARNHADSLIFTAEKSLKDAGDKVSQEVKTEVEEKIKALKDILDSGSKEELEAKTNELSESLQKIGQAAYQQGQQATTQEEIEKEEKEGKTDDSYSDSNSDSDKDKKEDKPVEGEVVE